MNCVVVIQFYKKRPSFFYFSFTQDILRSHDNIERNEGNDKNLFIIGVLVQFINPKGILYGITVVSTFILPYYTSYFSYFIFSLFLGIVGLMSSSFWSLFGSIFQKFLAKYRQLFNIIMALLLVYSAISIVFH